MQYIEYAVFIWKLFVIPSKTQKMYKVLFILFIIKLYARTNSFILWKFESTESIFTVFYKKVKDC